MMRGGVGGSFNFQPHDPFGCPHQGLVDYYEGKLEDALQKFENARDLSDQVWIGVDRV